MRSKLSQLLFIALDRSFSMESIYFFERGLRGNRSQTYPYMLSAKQGIIWYHFYKVFGMTRSGIEPTTSRLRGESFYQYATIAVYFLTTTIKPRLLFSHAGLVSSGLSISSIQLYFHYVMRITSYAYTARNEEKKQLIGKIIWLKEKHKLPPFAL